MAHLKHPEHGTEIEVDDEAAKAYLGSGWKAVDDDGDKPQRRRSTPRKGTDD